MSKKRNKGFTLIELLMVIGVMGIFAGIISIALIGPREKGQIAKAQSELSEIENAVVRLEVDTEEWPGHQNPREVCSGVCGNEVWDLNAETAGLTQDDSGTSFFNWRGPYITTIPLDPWGNPYFLDTDYSIQVNGDPCNGGGNCNDAAVLGSFGPNGAGQNVFDGDDIIVILTR